MSQALNGFYDDKYSAETRLSGSEIIKPVKAPHKRFEAVVRYFLQFIKGGDVLELGAGSGLIADSLLHICDEINNYTATEFSLPRLEDLNNSISDARIKV